MSEARGQRQVLKSLGLCMFIQWRLPPMAKTVRIGSDFSGLDTTVIAMRKVIKNVLGLHARGTR